MVRLLTRDYDIIVVGGGVAGINAATEARSVRPSCSVALIADESKIYSRPALTHAIAGHAESVDDVAIYTRSTLESLGVNTYFSSKIASLDANNRAVELKRADQEESLRYRSIVLATGSRPALPRVRGLELENVFSIKWAGDALRVSAIASPGMRACVVGAGFIGLEMAQALFRRGLKVTLVEMRPWVLPELLEPELSAKVKEHLERFDVKVLTDSSLESIHGRKRAQQVSVNGKRLKAELVAFATGVRPNVELAKIGKVKLGRTGAIATDRSLRTSKESVYAAGDCAETLDMVTGKVVYRPLGTVAARSGVLAGSNAAGKRVEYSGFLRRQYDRIFGTEIVSMGLSLRQARSLKVNAEAVPVEPPRHSDPKLQILRPSQALFRAVIEKKNQRLVGWQAVGRPIRTSWYSQFMQASIASGKTLDSLEELGLTVAG